MNPSLAVYPHGMKVLQPVYVWPSDEFAWSVAAAPLRSRPADQLMGRDVAIFNPASGPGTQMDPAWRARCAEAVGRYDVAGYVPLGYGNDAATLAAFESFSRWRKWYGPNHFFLDEFPMAVPGRLELLEGLVLTARRYASPGWGSNDQRRVIANPGTVPSRDLVVALPGIGVWVTHESRDVDGASVDDVGRPPCPWLPAHAQAFLTYADADPERTLARADELGWGWAGSSTDPAPAGNPWDGNPAT